jgi:hypothetical protein
MTSLNEIKSFKPCTDGWEDILKGQGKTISDDVQFPLVDCLKSNSISDVCWLLGKRKVEIQIAVRFAKMCADSIRYLNNYADISVSAAARASANAVYAANAASAADAAANDAYAAANATNATSAAANAVYAATNATSAALYATSAAANDAANAAASATVYAANAAANATNAANAANAASYAEQKQRELNKQFLTQCINEWTGE